MSTVLNFKCTPEYKENLVKTAKIHKISLSKLIRHAIDNYLVYLRSWKQ